jgi:hypothetical protein
MNKGKIMDKIRLLESVNPDLMRLVRHSGFSHRFPASVPDIPHEIARSDDPSGAAYVRYIRSAGYLIAAKIIRSE